MTKNWPSLEVMMSDKPTAQVTKLTALIQPIADDFHCELVEVDYTNGVLKVIVDEPDGLNSQTLVEVTKAVSRMIDADDPVPGKFTLEVTSPGVERPLKTPSHFHRSIGEDITLKTMPDVEGDRRVEGKLVNADEFGVTVEAKDGERTLRYGEIRSARTVFAWGPTPKKGGKSANKSADSSNDTANEATKKGQPA